MNNLKSIIILTLLFLSSLCSGQVVVYKTFKDFTNKKSEQYDDYKGYSHVMGKVRLRLKKGKKKVKLHCNDIWGFSYKDAFFRIDQNGMPARVMSAGKIIYYENGVAHLSMIKNNTETGNFSVGYYCYVSADINSELVPMPGELISTARKKIKKFKKENPQYKALFDCIEKNYDYKNVRPCIEEFEKEE